MTSAPVLAPEPVQAPPERPDSGPPPAADRPGRRVWAWLRLLAILVLAAASELVYVAFWPLSYYLTQGSEFTYQYLLQYPEVWERLQPLLARAEARWPDGVHSLEFLVDALMWAFAAAFCLYLIVLLLVQWRLPPGWGWAVAIAPPLAFQVTLFLMPGLFTTDLFSYVTYGAIAGQYGFNPYIYLPSQFPENRVFHWIHPIWHHAPSIYGPAWIDLSWLVSRAIADWSDVDKVLTYKLIVNVAHLLGIGCLAAAVHRLRPGLVLPSVVLYAWNPLILFEYGGNGHNDAVMVAIVLLAAALYARGWPWAGLVAMSISFLIKMSTVLAVPYYVMAWARDHRSPLGFLLTLIASGVTVVGVVVAMYYPWWVGPATIGPILTWTEGPMYINYLPDLVSQRWAVERLIDGSAPDYLTALEESRAQMKQLTRAAFAAYCLLELVMARGVAGFAGAGARVMLGFLLIANTWVLPWYFTWPLALAAVVGWQSITAKVAIGFSLSAPTMMYYHHFWHPYMADSTYLVLLVPLLLVPVVWGGRLARYFGRLARRAWTTGPLRARPSAAKIEP